MSVPSWVKVGARCVFVGFTKADSKGFSIAVRPAAKTVYTIRETLVEADGIFVRLCEMRCSGKWADGSKFYDAWIGAGCFRPLISKSQEQDIALFRHHLDGVDA